MSHVTLEHFLVISSILFSLGIAGVLTRRNAISLLIGIELILNSACINFIAFTRFGSGSIEGSVFVLFVIVMAAAEAVVAMAIIFALQKRMKTVNIDRTDLLKG